MRIPLVLKLKKQLHKDVAKAQDAVVKELYKFFGDAVLHGGTAIWRCYEGNRFSEDIDAYMPRDSKKIDAFFNALEKTGFVIAKKKVGANSLFSNLQLNRAVVRFEAVFKKAHGVLKEYETADGNLITVYVLSPEELIKEKCAAYLKRLKARDLYDIFFLLRHVSDRRAVSRELATLAKNFKKPVDEKELKVLIIEGLVPDAEKMLEYVKDILKQV